MKHIETYFPNAMRDINDGEGFIESLEIVTKMDHGLIKQNFRKFNGISIGIFASHYQKYPPKELAVLLDNINKLRIRHSIIPKSLMKYVQTVERIIDQLTLTEKICFLRILNQSRKGSATPKIYDRLFKSINTSVMRSDEYKSDTSNTGRDQVMTIDRFLYLLDSLQLCKRRAMESQDIRDTVTDLVHKYKNHISKIMKAIEKFPKDFIEIDLAFDESDFDLDDDSQVTNYIYVQTQLHGTEMPEEIEKIIIKKIQNADTSDLQPICIILKKTQNAILWEVFRKTLLDRISNIEETNENDNKTLALTIVKFSTKEITPKFMLNIKPFFVNNMNNITVENLSIFRNKLISSQTPFGYLQPKEGVNEELQNFLSAIEMRMLANFHTFGFKNCNLGYLQHGRKLLTKALL
mmetsp:Transcript_16630/g.14529  ORF Transcript_16630/g.14529 Transcript_16630/m.14529 type:complete len:407 (-) Transcript_16630:19-1239(-)